MAHNTLAPWAELVPDVGPVTPDELLAWPDDGWRYELVEGWLVAPDLVAEVASPRQTPAEMEAKVRVWLAAGVRLAWVVWLRTQHADVWQPDAQGAAQRVATLGQGGALDGLNVLPGFSYPVADLFA